MTTLLLHDDNEIIDPKIRISYNQYVKNVNENS